MRLIVWKELRENGLWGLIASVIFILAVLHVLRPQLDSNFGGEFPLFDSSIQMISLFGPILLGGALGFLQIMPELRADRWAYLVHRPVPATDLFWGKVGAGFMLYLGALVVPLTGFLLWLSAPDRLHSLFHLSMARYLLIDLLSGIMVYLAAIVVALRQAKWWGTKLLPLVVALALNMIQNSAVQRFSTALAVSLVGIFLYVIAARGTWRSFGADERLHLGERVVLNGLLASGFNVLLLIILILYVNFYPPERRIWESYEIDDAGQVYVVRYQARPPENRKVLRIQGLDGKDYPVLGQNTDHPPIKFLSSYDDRQVDCYKIIESNYRSGMAYFLNAGTKPLGFETYFLPDPNLAVGFDLKSNKLCLAVTPDGITSTDRWPTQSFPSDTQIWSPRSSTPYSDYIIQQPHQIWHLDLARRTMIPLGEAPGEDRIKSIVLFRKNSDSAISTGLIVGEKKSYFYDWDSGRLVGTVILPKSPPEYETKRLAVNTKLNRFFFMQSPVDLGQEKFDTQGRSYLSEVSGEGVLVRTLELEAVEDGGDIYRPSQFLEALSIPHWAIAAGLAHNWFMAQRGDLRSKIDLKIYRRDLDRVMKGGMQSGSLDGVTWMMEVVLILLPVYLMALVISAVYFRVPKGVTLCWSLAILMFGLSGLLLFWVTHLARSKTRCPVCQQSSNAREGHCPHCQAPWPAPIRDGTEILEAPHRRDPA